MIDQSFSDECSKADEDTCLECFRYGMTSSDGKIIEAVVFAMLASCFESRLTWFKLKIDIRQLTLIRIRYSTEPHFEDEVGNNAKDMGLHR